MNSRISDLRPMQGGVSGVYGTDGICAVLLPLSILVPGVHSDLSIISLSLSLSSLLLYILDYRPTGSSAAFSLLSFLPAWLCIVLLPDLQTDSRFRLYLCFWTVLVYRPVFNNIVSRFKKSFTFGEACIVVQGGILATYTLINRLYTQGVFRRIDLAKQVVKWIDWFIDQYSTPSSILLISSWIVLGLLSVCVVVVYKHKGWPVHSRTRKLFHFAVILVYVPGLVVNPGLLYIASLGATTLFISLEALRYSGKLPRLTRPLTAHLEHFTDNKEGGSLILTNIYLLVGVSLPLWVWQGELNTPAPLTLFAGVLSVGVGDAMSSVVGTAVGRTRIFSTHKTLEGTLAGFLSQLGFGYLLSSVCGLEIPEPGFATVCLVTAGFELLVEQVDNLTLPLIMYIGLYIIST